MSTSKTSTVLRYIGATLAFLLLWKTGSDWRVTEGLRHHTPMAFAKVGLMAADGLLVSLWAFFPQKWDRLIRGVIQGIQKLGHFRWLVLVAWLLAFPYMVLYSNYTTKFEFVSVRWLLYLTVVLGTALLLSANSHTRLKLSSVLTAALLTGSTFAFLNAYTHVSSYPFRLSWSEGNRLWDYSLMFARNRYVYPANQPLNAHIDRGRQFLWGLIYLIPGVNIVIVRLWSAFLFTVPYLAFAWVAFLKPKRTRQLAFWAGLWGFLFLSQGPIYTPLLLSALAVAVAEMFLPWWLGLPLVAGAAYYAAITRYTWVFAPTAWAMILVMGSLKNNEDWQITLKNKGWWLIGGSLIGAVLSSRLASFLKTGIAILQKYLPFGATAARTPAVSVNRPAIANMTAQQPLIWSRLWPNPTFPPGILLGALIAVGPVLLLWWVWRRHGVWQMPKWASALIAAILTALLSIGLIISLKIGGGSNLHNLDMFLIAVLFSTAVLWQQGGAAWLKAQHWMRGEQIVLLLLVLAPMYFVFSNAQPRNIPPAKDWKPALAAVQQAVHNAKTQGSEVLFIDQRQLLTFGFVEPVPLVPEYEKKLMMDKAMASDAQYFARYYHDLATHRFAFIITEPLKTNYQTENKDDFASENNAWVKWVAAPTLCYYEPLATFKKVNLQILVPKKEHTNCLNQLPIPPAEQP